MFARSSTIRHEASGVELKTPLLIPSFSSKGFARAKGDGKSEIGKILGATEEFLTETYLISAYDVFYGDVPSPAELTVKPELIVLDSGGYEISTDRDYSAVIDPLPAPKDWDAKKWESVVSTWPNEVPLIAVSYDHHNDRMAFDKQVTTARRRFKKCKGHLHCLLIKPETPSQLTLKEVLKSVVGKAAELRSFDVIGVTEKELGRTMLDRMAQIATLRRALDEAGVAAPIHVFGALDPLSVCLYYVAGAEIFDGLTWIRYAFDNGRCIYTHNLGVLKYGISERDDAVKSRAMADNCYYLRDLQRRLRDFEATKKWEKLEPHADLIQNACDSLTTHLGRRA